MVAKIKILIILIIEGIFFIIIIIIYVIIYFVKISDSFCRKLYKIVIKY